MQGSGLLLPLFVNQMSKDLEYLLVHKLYFEHHFTIMNFDGNRTKLPNEQH